MFPYISLSVSLYLSQYHHPIGPIPYHPQKQHSKKAIPCLTCLICLACLACPPACPYGPCSLFPPRLGDHFPLSVTDRSGAHPGTEKEQRAVYGSAVFRPPKFPRGPAGGDGWIGCPPGMRPCAGRREGEGLCVGAFSVNSRTRDFVSRGEVGGVGHGISLGCC